MDLADGDFAVERLFERILDAFAVAVDVDVGQREADREHRHRRPVRYSAPALIAVARNRREYRCRRGFRDRPRRHRRSRFRAAGRPRWRGRTAAVRDTPGPGRAKSSSGWPRRPRYLGMRINSPDQPATTRSTVLFGDGGVIHRRERHGAGRGTRARETRTGANSACRARARDSPPHAPVDGISRAGTDEHVFTIHPENADQASEERLAAVFEKGLGPAHAGGRSRGENHRRRHFNSARVELRGRRSTWRRTATRRRRRAVWRSFRPPPRRRSPRA